MAAIIGAGIVPVAMEFMDKPAIEICEAFAHAGYPLDVEALLIIEVEGSDAEMDASWAAIVEIAQRAWREDACGNRSRPWRPPRSGRAANRPSARPGRVADYICMDGTIPTGQLPYVLRRMDEIVTSYGLRVANVFHAGDGNLHPLDHVQRQRSRGGARRPRRRATTSSSSAWRSAAA